MNILIVGASGNLGSHLTRYLLATPHRLRLLVHKRAMPFALPEQTHTEIVRGDLDDPTSLTAICRHIDCIVYLAGVLFQPQPEKFLHRTNTVYVQNIVNAARSADVGKFILVSFPHVEENTTPDAPALCEMVARTFRTAAPLNRDIVRTGMTSVVADTTRMKRDLMPKLIYPTLIEGLKTL